MRAPVMTEMVCTVLFGTGWFSGQGVPPYAALARRYTRHWHWTAILNTWKVVLYSVRAVLLTVRRILQLQRAHYWKDIGIRSKEPLHRQSLKNISKSSSTAKVALSHSAVAGRWLFLPVLSAGVLLPPA